MDDILGRKIKNGIVVSIIDVDWYCNTLLAAGINVDYTTWDQNYPGWRERPILSIFYDKPQKSLTFDEYISYNLDDPIELIRENYDALPAYYQLAIPYDVLLKEEENE